VNPTNNSAVTMLRGLLALQCHSKSTYLNLLDVWKGKRMFFKYSSNEKECSGDLNHSSAVAMFRGFWTCNIISKITYLNLLDV
jgi:hypothetical protein